MRKFIIERNLPGAGKLTNAELKAFSIKTCMVANSLEAPYHWIQTFVTDSKLYCIHIAPDRETVLEHASRAGFPADSITEIRNTIDPTTTTIPVEKQPRRVFE